MNDKEQRDIPENFDPKEYESLLKELGSSPSWEEFFRITVQEGERALTDSKEKVESMGITLEGAKETGFLYHFSLEQANVLWNHMKGRKEQATIDCIAKMMMRYYYLLWQSIKRKEKVCAFMRKKS